MNPLSLLLDSPLWIAVLVVTVGLHVAFFVAVRRLSRRDAPRRPEDRRPEDHGGQ